MPAPSILPLTVLPGLGYPVRWTPAFFNQSVKTVSGASIDIGLAAFPIHNFELQFPLVRDFSAIVASEFRTLMSFFMFQQGSLGRWLYLNPDDNAVLAQHVGTGDGSTVNFPIVRTFQTFQNEPVGYVNVTGLTLNIYFNGVLHSSYPGSAAEVDNTVPGAPQTNLSVAPGAGVNVTMDFSFYYYCQFSEDSLMFEKFADKYWLQQSMKFRSCRAKA